MLPPLTKFLAETKEYIDSGVLRLGDQTVDFADYGLLGAVPGAMDLTVDEIGGINPEEEVKLVVRVQAPRCEPRDSERFNDSLQG